MGNSPNIKLPFPSSFPLSPWTFKQWHTMCTMSSTISFSETKIFWLHDFTIFWWVLKPNQEEFQNIRILYNKTYLIQHLCNLFHWVIEFDFHFHLNFMIVLSFTLNPTPCLFRHKISFQVQIRLNRFHCIYNFYINMWKVFLHMNLNLHFIILLHIEYILCFLTMKYLQRMAKILIFFVHHL